MNTETKKQKLPKWFEGSKYTIGANVTNPFSGESYQLNNIELSMYDFIMGAQFLIEMNGGPFSEDSVYLQNETRKGIDWFRENNAEAYMVLLD